MVRYFQLQQPACLCNGMAGLHTPAAISYGTGWFIFYTPFSLQQLQLTISLPTSSTISSLEDLAFFHSDLAVVHPEHLSE